MSVLFLGAAALAGGPATQEGTRAHTRGVSREQPASAMPPGDRWALLIGIDKYEHMPHIRFCGRDMQQLRQTLITHGGYEPARVRLLTDADKDGPSPSRGNILIGLKAFLQQAKPRDTVFVAFSGHGESKEDRSYLMPIDGDPSPEMLDYTALPISVVNEFIGRCPARQKVLVIDACHSGGRKDGQPVGGLNPDVFAGGQGTLELFSCEVNESSWECDTLKQGVFSHFLARALEGEADMTEAGNRDGEVSADEVYAHVHRRVGEYVREHFGGQRQTPRKRGEVSGTIILASRSTPASELGLPPEQIIERLNRLHRDRQVSSGPCEAAREWLSAPPEFGPGKEMRLLLSLLSERAITEPQFNLLSKRLAPRLVSHGAAAAAWNKRRLRAVALGINDYPEMPLKGAVADTELVFETIMNRQAQRPPAADAVLLVNAEATRKRLLEELRRAAATSQPGDILVVFFSGHGGNRELEQGGKKRVESCWMMTPADPHSAAGRATGVVPLRDVVDAVDTSPAHVLIVGCCAQGRVAHWPDLAQDPTYEEGPIRTVRERPARVFIGYRDYCVEGEVKGMTALAMILAEGLSGRADHAAVRALRPEDAAPRIADEEPDGFVTLRELVRFCQAQFAARQAQATVAFDPFGETPVMQGHLGRGDAVLTKSDHVVE